MPARKTPRPALGTPAQRFRHAQQELHQLDYFLKGTVSKRMMKCGQPQCPCHRDPSQRHGPYFEWTYKVQGKTVNVKLSSQAAPLYLAATKQNRKLKAVLARMERSEEHTSELQSPCNLVCRLLLEKKKNKRHNLTLVHHHLSSSTFRYVTTVR